MGTEDEDGMSGEPKVEPEAEVSEPTGKVPKSLRWRRLWHSPITFLACYIASIFLFPVVGLAMGDNNFKISNAADDGAYKASLREQTDRLNSVIFSRGYIGDNGTYGRLDPVTASYSALLNPNEVAVDCPRTVDTNNYSDYIYVQVQFRASARPSDYQYQSSTERSRATNGQTIIDEKFASNEAANVTVRYLVDPGRKQAFDPTRCDPNIAAAIVDVAYDARRPVDNLRRLAEGDPTYGPNPYLRMLYLSAVVQTTTGFGDILPITTNGRLMVTVQLMIGLGTAGLFFDRLARRKWQSG